MKHLLLAAAIVSVGCAAEPVVKEPLAFHNYYIGIHVVSPAEIKEKCDNNLAVACTRIRPNTNVADIYISGHNYCHLTHELDHAFYGAWHGEGDSSCGRYTEK